MNKILLKYGALALIACSMTFVSCSDDEVGTTDPVVNTDRYELEDRAARPGISAVFVTSADKDAWNTSVPSAQGAEYATKFNDQLLALNPGYTTNALTWDAATFSGALATDVLTVATSGTTTYFDGTNVLTGRNLADDVISTSLLLIFGGPDGSENPTLSSDNVTANDKAFLSTFPYLATPH